jgi:hypothetical protein
VQRQCSGGAEGAEQVKRSIGADIDEHKMQILRFRGVQEEPRYARRCENFSKIARRCEKVHDNTRNARNARRGCKQLCEKKACEFVR